MLRNLLILACLVPTTLVPTLGRAEAPVAAPLIDADAGPATPAIGPVERLAKALQSYQQLQDSDQGVALVRAMRQAQAIRQRAAGAWQSQEQAIERPLSPDPAAKPPAAKLARLADLTGPDAQAVLALLAEEDDTLADILAQPNPPQGSVSRQPGQLTKGRLTLWQIPFEGHSPAELAVFFTSTPARDQLIWQVQDSYATQICPPQDASSVPVCAFTPQSNGFYQIQIENHGPTDLTYALISN